MIQWDMYWLFDARCGRLPISRLLGLLSGKVRAHLCAVAGRPHRRYLRHFSPSRCLRFLRFHFFYCSALSSSKSSDRFIAAVFLYDIPWRTAQFEIMKQSVAGHHSGSRLQLLSRGLLFGAFSSKLRGIRPAPVATPVRS